MCNSDQRKWRTCPHRELMMMDHVTSTGNEMAPDAILKE